MPRIRAIKPEFWSSPNLPADPWTRLLYIAMWNWADDNGVGTAGERELLAFAFPNDENISTADIRRMYGGIRRVFDVSFYTVAGRPYYSIPSWREHQKFDNRGKGKHPGPEDAETWLYQEEPENTAGTRRGHGGDHRNPGAGTGEQGNRGTGEISSRPPVQTEPTTRAPRKTGAELVRDKYRALNESRQSADAQMIATAFSDSLPVPIQSELLGKIATEIEKLIRDGIPPPAIANGLRAWVESDSFSPTQIPNFALKANRGSRATKPTEKALGYDQALNELLQEVTTL